MNEPNKLRLPPVGEMIARLRNVETVIKDMLVDKISFEIERNFNIVDKELKKSPHWQPPPDFGSISGNTVSFNFRIMILGEFKGLKFSTHHEYVNRIIQQSFHQVAGKCDVIGYEMKHGPIEITEQNDQAHSMALTMTFTLVEPGPKPRVGANITKM